MDDGDFYIATSCLTDSKINLLTVCVCKVIEETICRCVGLKDKNGTLIWENDVALTPKEDGCSLIGWNDTEAKWEMHNETEGIVLDFDNYWANEIEVVGNRLDNPELLECDEGVEK